MNGEWRCVSFIDTTTNRHHRGANSSSFGCSCAHNIEVSARVSCVFFGLVMVAFRQSVSRLYAAGN